MNKKVNIIVTLIISFFIIGSIMYKSNIEDDVYIVSESEYNNEEEYNTDNIEDKNKENRILKNVTIYISGEVNNPGVVTIESDKRLSDAVEILGGVTENADLNKINLAIKLNDEQHYIIPKIGEVTTNNEASNIDEKNSKININTASLEELDNLPGVGEATANKILSYREEKGEFKSIEEIKNVNGIGDKKYIDLKEKICIE